MQIVEQSIEIVNQSIEIVNQSIEIATKMAVKITMIPINFNNFDITLFISEI